MKEINPSYIERDLAAVKAAEIKLQGAIAKQTDATEKSQLAQEAVSDAKRNLTSARARFYESVDASKGGIKVDCSDLIARLNVRV